jgi:hypothetical protein
MVALENAVRGLAVPGVWGLSQTKGPVRARGRGSLELFGDTVLITDVKPGTRVRLSPLAPPQPEIGASVGVVRDVANGAVEVEWVGRFSWHKVGDVEPAT